jgi:hypothetical protein
MHIPFPCPKPLKEMKPFTNGFYCDDCSQAVIEVDDKSSVQLSGHICVIDNPLHSDATAETHKPYHFALALFIVMGSSFILPTHAAAKNVLSTLGAIQSSFHQTDSTSISLRFSFVDENGNPIKPVKLKITLANGKIIEQKVTNSYHASVAIPRHQSGKTISVEFSYFKQSQTQQILVDANIIHPCLIVFERNHKDPYNFKRYPRTIGTPSF